PVPYVSYPPRHVQGTIPQGHAVRGHRFGVPAGGPLSDRSTAGVLPAGAVLQQRTPTRLLLCARREHRRAGRNPVFHPRGVPGDFLRRRRIPSAPLAVPLGPAGAARPRRPVAPRPPTTALPPARGTGGGLSRP